MRVADPVRAVAKSARSDQSGGVAVLSALMMPFLAGGIALSVDISLWRCSQMRLQSQADAAATEAVYTLRQGGSQQTAVSDAKADATNNGWLSTLGSATVNIPPVKGAQAGNVMAAEVVLTTSVQSYFSKYLGWSGMSLTARSVASTHGTLTGSGCVLALDPSVAQAVSLSNNASVPNPACEVLANSSSNDALDLANNASIAGRATVVGNMVLANNASVGTKVTGVSHFADPYAGKADLPSTAAGSCVDSSGAVSFKNNATTSLSPGHYCSGWTMKNNATLNLSPGIYYVDSAFNIGNNAVINATGGVTIVLGPGYTFTLGNNAAVNITAPTSGPSAGVVLTQYTNDTTVQTVTFTNNASFLFTGAIYLPTKTVYISNNGTVGAASGSKGCGHIVADIVTVMNNAQIGNNCSGTGVQPFGTQQSSWLAASSSGAIGVSE